MHAAVHLKRQSDGIGHASKLHANTKALSAATSYLTYILIFVCKRYIQKDYGNKYYMCMNKETGGAGRSAVFNSFSKTMSTFTYHWKVFHTGLLWQKYSHKLLNHKKEVKARNNECCPNITNQRKVCTWAKQSVDAVCKSHQLLIQSGNIMHICYILRSNGLKKGYKQVVREKMTH